MKSGTLAQGFETAWFHLNTLFLFTKSDFKTVMLPQSAFAISMALSTNGVALMQQHGLEIIAPRLPYMLTWLWLHLLIENISNQRQPDSISEDKINKPWRPLPAGRLTPAAAQELLRILVPLALVLSTLLGSLLPSVTLMTMIWLYNDLDGSSVCLLHRNVLNAVGLACFGWGGVSVLLAGSIGREELLRDWITLTAAVVATTVHTQDLPDMAGDKARGRKTIPLVYGEGWARWSVALLLPSWSTVCLGFWRAPVVVWAPLLTMACIMGLLVLVRRDGSADKLVWKLWCLWMSGLYLLPMSSRASG